MLQTISTRILGGQIHLVCNARAVGISRADFLSKCTAVKYASYSYSFDWTNVGKYHTGSFEKTNHFTPLSKTVF